MSALTRRWRHGRRGMTVLLADADGEPVLVLEREGWSGEPPWTEAIDGVVAHLRAHPEAEPISRERIHPEIRRHVADEVPELVTRNRGRPAIAGTPLVHFTARLRPETIARIDALGDRREVIERAVAALDR